MGKVIVTLKIMPESPDADLKEIEKKAEEIIRNYDGQVGKVEEEPIAFGLKALKIIFLADEEKGNTDAIEEGCKKLANISSAEITDMRRSL